MDELADKVNFTYSLNFILNVLFYRISKTIFTSFNSSLNLTRNFTRCQSAREARN